MLAQILLGLFMALQAPAVQESQQETPNYHVFAPPEVDISLADVIDILTDYDFTHDKANLLAYMGFNGLTSTETKHIYINHSADMATRRDTVIHEILHVILWKKGYDARGTVWEYFIAAKTNEIYQKIYPAKKADSATQTPILVPIQTQD